MRPDGEGGNTRIGGGGLMYDLGHVEQESVRLGSCQFGMPLLFIGLKVLNEALGVRNESR